MKKILISLAVIAILFGAIFITGKILPEKHSITVTDTIRAPKEEVYMRVTIVSEYELWRKSIREVKTFTPREWIEINTDQDTIRYRMTVLDEFDKVLTTIESDHLPFSGHWIFEFEALRPNLTKLTITENGRVYNPFHRFFGKFIIGYDATIKEYLRDLKRSFGYV